MLLLLAGKHQLLGNNFYRKNFSLVSQSSQPHRAKSALTDLLKHLDIIVGKVRQVAAQLVPDHSLNSVFTGLCLVLRKLDL